MMFKHTVKSIMSNFNLVWKILLYLVFSTAITIGLMYACSLPVIKIIQEKGVFESTIGLFKDFSIDFNIYKLLSGLVESVGLMYSIIVNNISKLWLYIVLLLLIVFVVGPFLSGFYKFAASNVLYNHFSSNIKIGFMSSLFSCFKLNLKYQLASLITQLPVDIILCTLLYIFIRLILMSEGLFIIAPIMLMLVIMLLLSFRIVLFSGWIPAMIVFDCGVWQGFKRGMKAVFRRFYLSMSTAFLIVMTLFVLNIIFALCTFGASILITIPLSFFTIIIFNMVMFYSSQGMRFYVDSDNIVTPKRLEETENISRLKYIL